MEITTDYKTLKLKIKKLSKDTTKNYDELLKIYQDLLINYYNLRNNHIKK
jgi:hypothetical protein